jgi:hypothetical protein
MNIQKVKKKEVKRLDYGLENTLLGIRFQVGTRDMSLLHCIQNGSETHTDSYPTDNGGSFPSG